MQGYCEELRGQRSHTKSRERTTKVSPTGMRQQGLTINHENSTSKTSEHQKCLVYKACAKDTAKAHFSAFPLLSKSYPHTQQSPGQSAASLGQLPRNWCHAFLCFQTKKGNRHTCLSSMHFTLDFQKFFSDSVSLHCPDLLLLSLGRIKRLTSVKYTCAFCPLLITANETWFKGCWM